MSGNESRPRLVPTQSANSHHADSASSSTDIEQAQNEGTTETKQPEDDVPPDGGYGWVCVACNFMINAHTWGINSTYAVFLAYYLNNNYFPNTSALAYAFIGGLSISMAMFIAPVATFVVRTCGTKVALHVGIFFETLSLIGASFATKKYQIILAQGVCFGWGMGFLFVASVGIIPQWFVRKRSIANAVAAAGSGLGGLIWSLATQSMIRTLGLPWAFRVLGIVSGGVNLIASNVIRDRNKAVGARHKSFDTVMIKRPEFLLVQAWSWFSMLGYVIVLFSLPSYARAIGLSAEQGSIIGAIFNLGQMLGRPFIGLASDRWGRINLAAFFSAMCGVFCFIFWIPAEAAPSHMGLLTFFSIVGGALAGTFWTTIAPVGAEVVGIRDLPSALSWTWLVMVPPVTCAEPIALELRRNGVVHWIYLHAQLFCGFMYIAAGLCLWVVRGWKIGELEVKARLDEKMKRLQERQQQQQQLMVTNEKREGGVGTGEEATVAEAAGPGERHASHDSDLGHPLTKEESAKIARDAGWRPKELIRLMFKPKIV